MIGKVELLHCYAFHLYIIRLWWFHWWGLGRKGSCGLTVPWHAGALTYFHGFCWACRLNAPELWHIPLVVNYIDPDVTVCERAWLYRWLFILMMLFNTANEWEENMSLSFCALHLWIVVNPEQNLVCLFKSVLTFLYFDFILQIP